MNRRPSLSGFRVLVFLMLSAASAWAQTAEQMARQRFDEGNRYYAERRYEAARAAFLQAHALESRPEYLVRLAHAELRSGQPAKAANHFAEYLSNNPEAPEADRQEAELDFAAAKAKVAEVRIQTEADGAEILVDGDVAGRAPLDRPLYVAPGAHTFAVRLGESSGEKRVTTSAGQSSSVELSLGAGAPAPPAVAPAAADAGASPPSAPLSDDDADLSADTATGGRKPVLEWFFDTPLAWVGAGIAVAGLAIGTTFAFTSKTHFDRANQLREDMLRANENLPPSDQSDAVCVDLPGAMTASFLAGCEEWRDERDTGNRQKTIAIVGFAAGGAAALGTAVYYFVDPNAKKETARWRLRPRLGAGYRGAELGVSF